MNSFVPPWPNPTEASARVERLNELDPTWPEWFDAAVLRRVARENGWRLIESPHPQAPEMWVHRPRRLSVGVSGARELDNRRWVHLSIASPDHLPSWDDLTFAKRCFLGSASKAIQVLPPDAEWINHHSYCLHLFTSIDGDGLPDFTREGGTL